MCNNCEVPIERQIDSILDFAEKLTKFAKQDDEVENRYAIISQRCVRVLEDLRDVLEHKGIIKARRISKSTYTI